MCDFLIFRVNFVLLVVQTQQKAVKAADERYRREIEAHAGAITALRQAEDAEDVSRSLHFQFFVILVHTAAIAISPAFGG